MDIFTQKKCLIRVTIGLAVVNIALMLWITFSYENHSTPPPPKRQDLTTLLTILKKELQLTPNQVAQIETLRADYFAQEKELLHLVQSKRDSMNVEMFLKTTDPVLMKALAERLAEHKVELEWIRYEQSKTFKAICTPEQLDKFGNLVKEIRRYFKSDEPPQK
ncbi:MAG: motif family protein [Bacteroidota bacterium]|jgi:Spy/CpxP family protein refolding chaperone